MGTIDPLPVEGSRPEHPSILEDVAELSLLTADTAAVVDLSWGELPEL
jgi:hypothetical protein